jgi:putative nucleotidyltransferase with HDIG domain
MSRSLRSIFRIVLLYVLFAALWIFFSDQAANYLQARYHLPEMLETYKGFLFVLVSGLLIFSLLYRALRDHEARYDQHLQEKEELLQRLKQKNLDLLEAYDKTIFGWSRVLEMRSREVTDHSRRVTDLTIRLASHLGIGEPDLSHIRRGALLHDIGKMAIPDEIILKNGSLSEEERALIRRHPLLGFEMLSEIEYLRPAIDILLCHHEKWNGEGYPFGLAGDQIPLYARIFAVADVWDALVSERRYREAQSPETAIQYLRSESGQHFDPEIVEAFLKMIAEDGYPADA